MMKKQETKLVITSETTEVVKLPADVCEVGEEEAPLLHL